MSDESFRTSVIEGDLQARGLRVAVLAREPRRVRLLEHRLPA